MYDDFGWWEEQCWLVMVNKMQQLLESGLSDIIWCVVVNLYQQDFKAFILAHSLVFYVVPSDTANGWLSFTKT